MINVSYTDAQWDKIKASFFSYTDAHWDKIKGVVCDGLGRDADQIKRPITRTFGTSSLIEMQTLRDRIELAASAHIFRSAVERETPGQKGRIQQLTELRERTYKLEDDILVALSFSHTGAPLPGVDGELFDKMHRLFTKEIDQTLRREIARLKAMRPTANTSKHCRDQLWAEAVAIWRDLGGKPTGADAAKFIVAISKPVFDAILANGRGGKTAAAMPLNYESVQEWLRLRAKRCTSAEVRSIEP